MRSMSRTKTLSRSSVFSASSIVAALSLLTAGLFLRPAAADTAGNTVDQSAPIPSYSTSDAAEDISRQELIVNGKHIPLPTNGTYQSKSVDDQGTETEISAESHHSSTEQDGASHVQTSTSITVTSNNSGAVP